MAPPASKELPVTGKKPGRNAFVRTKVSPLERVISLVIVCLLAAIGVAIAINGRHFDPHIYSLRPDALKSTEAAVEGKSGTLRSEASGKPAGPAQAKVAAAKPSTGEAPAAEGDAGYEAEGGAPSKPVAKGGPMEIALPGIKPMGDTEFYSADNLFEKIDGRAPAYLGFNFQQLRSRSFAIVGAEGSYVDVYEYRMDTPMNAFGIFALERDPQGKPIGFAPDGYSGEMGFFYRQGACYVQIIASDQNPKTMEVAKAIAENRAKALPADDKGLDARRRLPADGMIPESVTFVQENAQGQEFLKNVFQAVYKFEDAKLPFFLMVATPEAAAGAFKSYQDFIARFGKATALPDVDGAHIFQAESFGKCKVIYQREGEIGGVYDAADPEIARKFVEQYLQGKIR